MRVLIIISVFVAILFVSCTEKSEMLIVPDYSNYFPIAQGQVQFFEVREINIDAPLEIYDTTLYNLKIVADTVYSSGDTLLGFYSILKSPSGAEQWVPVGRVVREIQSPVGNYIETQNNCRKIKARLPMRNSAHWNPNIYCISSDSTDMSEIKALDVPRMFAGQGFDSVVHIVNQYDSSLIHLDVKQEYYAANFGLVYLEETKIVSNSSDLDFTKPIRERIVVGQMVEIRQLLTSPIR
ncbi:MAG: hypothetical protein PHU27_08085 [Salinivirgaceae bacterium]|nr:hypothetical protein [Salinivirgaceae bacterium]MDD4746977.1 hypothetical protein [Salinivirgaceae bacterium]MDY0280531.1 hypothetical protein [Salinivirgaceae bacterium]